MEYKKFLQIGLICSIITIFCLIWELSNLPLSATEIFIIIFRIIIGISGIFSDVFITIWIIKSKT